MGSKDTNYHHIGREVLAENDKAAKLAEIKKLNPELTPEEVEQVYVNDGFTDSDISDKSQEPVKHNKSSLEADKEKKDIFKEFAKKYPDMRGADILRMIESGDFPDEEDSLMEQEVRSP